MRLWMAALIALGTPLPSHAADEPAVGVVREQNLVYCVHGGEALRLDLARPGRAANAPVILFVHGGAWVEGSRDAYSSEIVEAAQAGYVSATVDYRLSRDGRNPFPAHLADIQCAIRWVRANAAALGADPARIGIAGGSAGGHLSLLAGLAPGLVPPGAEEPFAQYSATVQAVVNFYGPTDLLAMLHETPNLGPTIRSVFADPWTASPIAYVSRESPPILTLHGSEDDTVSYLQALRLDQRAREVGARHELVRFEGEGHGFTPAHRLEANAVMMRFFDRVFSHPAKMPSRGAKRLPHRARCPHAP